MIITISGKTGSGKSTIAMLNAKKLKLKHYSIGDLTRKIAKKKGISILELARLEERDTKIDKALDNFQKVLGKTKDNFVIDGRISYYFISDSIKIFLDVNDDIAVKRINKDKRKTELNITVKEIRQRRKSEKNRYNKLYKINPYQKSNYDFIINTTNLTIDQTLNKVLRIMLKDKN